MEKGWSLDIKDNYLISAFDQGCYAIHIGSEYPVFASRNGKLICIKNQSVFSINLKALICKESPSKKSIVYQ